MSDDAQYVEATLAGDTAAFGHLVGRYQNRLHNSVVRYLGSEEDARDIVQDAFVQAFVKLETFRGSSAFFTWLYRIAFNLAASHLRRRRNVHSLDASKDACGEEPLGRGEAPEDGVLRAEAVEQVHAALGELADEHRQVIVLREIDGMTYDQIADVLEVPVGTVRSRLFRARMQLRGCLNLIVGEEAEEGRADGEQDNERESLRETTPS